MPTVWNLQFVFRHFIGGITLCHGRVEFSTIAVLSKITSYKHVNKTTNNEVNPAFPALNLENEKPKFSFNIT